MTADPTESVLTAMRDERDAANRRALDYARELGECRTSLADQQAHTEQLAERLGAMALQYDSDQERATAQLQALGRDLGRAHQQYRQVVADHAALAGMLESVERECEKYRIDILKLKALLWDQAQAGANGHAKPYSEGSAV